MYIITLLVRFFKMILKKEKVRENSHQFRIICTAYRSCFGFCSDSGFDSGFDSEPCSDSVSDFCFDFGCSFYYLQVCYDIIVAKF